LNIFDPSSFLKSLTPKPGVYQMLDVDSTVIYVGKARNLKNRVSSYFGKKQDSAKTRALVAQIQGIQVTVTHTEGEALLLENNLIKELKPRYNIVFRDDKSYPYLYLSSDQDYPRLSFYRGARRGKGRFFGPYPSAGSARRALNLVQKLFQLRQCDESFFKNRSRPCLQFQIKRCTAPCVDYISEEDYADDMKYAVMFLEGKNEEVMDALLTPMQNAADKLEYERAAHYRDQISNLRKVQEQQHVTAPKGEMDIIACSMYSGMACVQIFYIRGGLSLGNKSFFPRHGKGEQPEDIVTAFISQYYLSGRSDRQSPPTILISHEVEDADMFELVLSEQSSRKVKIQQSLRGEKKRWMVMALENATIALQQKQRQKENHQDRIDALCQALELEDGIERIECFDISHTGGEATVGSCVVFGIEGALKSDYRRFNVKDIEPGDDYAAMKQVLSRRYTRVKTEDGKLPDLILIDGGKGQISSSREILTELQLDSIPLVGVAKGPGRKPGLEVLIMSDGKQEVRLPANSAALHLIQEIRDEAHRFAITGHRQRRKKARNRSVLEDVEGVGAKRRQQLLRHFGGMQSIARAGVEDLAKVVGINKNLAQKIYDAFHT
jgi:excinuclease ABC subunit C